VTATLTPAGEDLEDLIRQAIEEARQNGDPEPGRPTLAKRFGVREHQVRQALANVRQAADEAPTATLTALPTSWRGEAAEPPMGTGLAPAGSQPGAAPGQAGASGGNQQLTGVARPRFTLAKLYTLSGFIFGSATSVAFNVLAARIPPDDAPKGWVPDPIAELGAAVWPLILLLSVEVISRVPFPKGWLWGFAKGAGIAAVALGSAVISYQHIQAVLSSWHYNDLSAGVGPLVVDGLMVLCGFAMLAEAGERRAARAARPSPSAS